MVLCPGKSCSDMALPFHWVYEWRSRGMVLPGQEHGDVPDEEFGILVLRAVIAVGIEDELGVRQVLLQNERVHGR